MTNHDQVCLTFEAAIERAIEMENEGFRNYLKAIRMVKDKKAKEMLRESAADELGHKHQLEKALLDGSVDSAGMDRPLPTMNLDYLVGKKELSPTADVREALAFAIHLEKEATQFYHQMANACAGAPMAVLFAKLGNEESRHLQSLEDLYEEHYLTEN